MKIYTKTGDAGETGLLGGRRVSKSCVEMAAIGDVDELNAAVGVLVVLVGAGEGDGIGDAGEADELGAVHKKLQQVQHTLFNVGANLAAVHTEVVTVPPVTAAHVAELEAWIDVMEAELPTLTQFILPSGTPAAAQSFLARAVCRRAERQVVALQEKLAGAGVGDGAKGETAESRAATLDPNLQKYLNRLSDALFVLGRWLNGLVGAGEVGWVR